MTNRFEGIQNLYTPKGMEKIRKSRVLIVGIGGVGTWAAESLVRSGIMSLTIVDLDEICISNTNRQIHALSTTVGKSKVQTMAERLRLINPDINLKCIEDFFTKSTADEILAPGFDYIIDAIDSLKYKVLLTLEGKKRSIPVIVTGASGGKTDPSKVQIRDINRAEQDKLLKQMRRILKRYHGYKTKGNRCFGIESICSSEPTQTANLQGCELKSASLSNCETGLGSASFVTGTFGFFAASWVINKITQSESSLDI